MPKEEKTLVKGYVTISGTLLAQVRKWFDESLQFLAGGGVEREKDARNGFSNLALPSYIVATAAVEAFVNEAFLSQPARLNFAGSRLYSLEPKRLEWANIKEKVIIVADLMLKTRIDRGRQPFQDFRLLTNIRNELVHYKMADKGFAFARHLKQIGVGLDVKASEGFEDHLEHVQPWVWEISSTEGIRWAYNAAAGMMSFLIELLPQEEEEFHRRGLEVEMPYGRFRIAQRPLLTRLPSLKPIEDKDRDRIWDELKIGM